MKLIRANVNDCEKIWKMQTEAFSDLLERYQDYETSPGNEAKERIEAKLSQEFTYFYYIFDGDDLVGAIRVVDKKDGRDRNTNRSTRTFKKKRRSKKRKEFCLI